ncbi:helix-turn-helix, Psq domain containing protein [Caulobacter sp. AP07]|uniref:helix-turn-helix domain-containing protein n=1 Tax=Caulobacter sp. AP07 TaxID=1144304 RepID=UPI0002720C63|nr:helix-turn-helix, Psq domain containing protein [Caulobacter sp. AP07]
MAKSYSLDLRHRVISAVVTGGMSRRQAAARFGVSPSSAINWVARFGATGSAAPRKVGGYKLRTIRGEHAVWLIARCREKPFTFRGLVAELRIV